MQKFIRFSVIMMVSALVMIGLGCAGGQKSMSQENVGASQQGVDLTGFWYLEVVTSRGSGNPTFELEQQGDQISGSYSGAFGTYPVSGSVTGNNFVMQYQASDMLIKYIGQVDGNKMKGEIDFGGQGKGTFMGEK